MILVDTSIWIDYLHGKESRGVELLENAMAHDIIVVGDLILAELLQGLKSDAAAQEVETLLGRCQYENLVGYDTAIAAAKNYRLLRSKGVTVRKTIDMLIGTFCITRNLWLLHNDRDFDPLEQYLGLRVVK